MTATWQHAGSLFRVLSLRRGTEHSG